jgi:CsoR family transcriptional regulator, copper-sensing transcriptional repressor
MARNRKSHGGVPVDHTKQLPRLRRIEGQVRGLQKMIEDGRDCIEVAHQINAVIAALRRVQGDMLREHLEASSKAVIAGRLSEAECRRLADEVGSLIKRMI